MTGIRNTYDENISQNKFYIALSTTFFKLYEHAVNEKWLILIPRAGLLLHTTISEEVIFSHILVPLTDLSFGGSQKDHSCDAENKKEKQCLATHKNLRDQNAFVNNGRVLTGEGYPSPGREYLLLFDEQMHDVGGLPVHSLYVVDGLLNAAVQEFDDVEHYNSGFVLTLKSLEDCQDILWGQSNNRALQLQIDRLITSFNNSFSMNSNDLIEEVALQQQMIMTWRSTVYELYNKCLMAALKDKFVRRMARVNEEYLNCVKIAMETYMHHGIYQSLIKSLKNLHDELDARVNKVARNLPFLTARHLGVRLALSDGIPRARRELLNLSKLQTPLGKCSCLRRVVNYLHQSHSSTKQPSIRREVISAEDLLPMMSFLIIKSEISNWYSYLYYMQHFRFAQSSNNDEFSYLLTTLEGSLTYVLLLDYNVLDDILTMHKQARQLSDAHEETATSIDRLFQLVAEGDVEQVRLLLNLNKNNDEQLEEKICHPLCSCEKCTQRERFIGQIRKKKLHANSHNEGHWTCLHVAAFHGQHLMIDILLRLGANPNTFELLYGSTPLHLACGRGHKDVTLLLLDALADMNALDHLGSCALHWAADRGHEGTINALLRVGESQGTLDVNMTNDAGNTALHLAARWGYTQIVQLLLGAGASIEQLNKVQKTAAQCAANPRLAAMISQSEAQYKQSTSVQRKISTSLLPVSNSRMSESGVCLSTSSTSSFHETNGTCNAGASLTASVVSEISASSELFQFANLTKRSPSQLLTPRYQKIEKFLRHAANGDLQMVRFLLRRRSCDQQLPNVEEKAINSSFSHPSSVKLCHPLCQCQQCASLLLSQQNELLAKSDELHIDSASPEGFTALHACAVHGCTEIVRFLLQCGANPQACSVAHRLTPLHLAAHFDQPLVIRELLAVATVDVRDAAGSTPLHYAAARGHAECVVELLTKGAKCLAQNKRGNSPLHEAARYGQEAVALLLLRHAQKQDDPSKLVVLSGLRNKQQLTASQLASTPRLRELLESAPQLLEAARLAVLSQKQKSCQRSQDENSEATSGVHSAVHSPESAVFPNENDNIMCIQMRDLDLALEPQVDQPLFSPAHSPSSILEKFPFNKDITGIESSGVPSPQHQELLSELHRPRPRDYRLVFSSGSSSAE